MDANYLQHEPAIPTPEPDGDLQKIYTKTIAKIIEYTLNFVNRNLLVIDKCKKNPESNF